MSPPGSSWRRLGRWVLLAVLVAVVLVLLFEVVFPWVETTWYDPTIG